MVPAPQEVEMIDWRYRRVVAGVGVVLGGLLLTFWLGLATAFAGLGPSVSIARFYLSGAAALCCFVAVILAVLALFGILPRRLYVAAAVAFALAAILSFLSYWAQGPWQEIVPYRALACILLALVTPWSDRSLSH
jgi:hypothetical protein